MRMNTRPSWMLMSISRPGNAAKAGLEINITLVLPSFRCLAAPGIGEGVAGAGPLQGG